MTPKTTPQEQKSKVFEITKYGQKIWLDDILIDMIETGEFSQMMQRDGLTGVTTNPSIFEKAVRTNPKYADRIKQLGEDGLDVHEVYEEMIIQDVQKVADVLKPVYDASGGTDGFVSIEINPELAYNSKESIDEAIALHIKVKRPNLLIKVPGTKEGEKAIRHLIGKGISINVTLLFSVDQYLRTVNAYFRGLDDYIEQGGDPGSVVSVASVFVSRIDTLIDRLLDQIIQNSNDNEMVTKAKALIGKGAIANSKLVYKEFENAFLKKNFEPYRSKNANPQEIVWGSTSVKDPAYRDVRYVEEIIGPYTINTMPLNTLIAFRDHGIASRSIDVDVEEAKSVITQLESLGISMGNVCEKLQREGVEAFIQAFGSLVDGIKETLYKVSEEDLTSIIE